MTCLVLENRQPVSTGASMCSVVHAACAAQAIRYFTIMAMAHSAMFLNEQEWTIRRGITDLEQCGLTSTRAAVLISMSRTIRRLTFLIRTKATETLPRSLSRPALP